MVEKKVEKISVKVCKQEANFPFRVVIGLAANCSRINTGRLWVGIVVYVALLTVQFQFPI